MSDKSHSVSVVTARGRLSWWGLQFEEPPTAPKHKERLPKVWGDVLVERPTPKPGVPDMVTICIEPQLRTADQADNCFLIRAIAKETYRWLVPSLDQAVPTILWFTATVTDTVPRDWFHLHLEWCFQKHPGFQEYYLDGSKPDGADWSRWYSDPFVRWLWEPHRVPRAADHVEWLLQVGDVRRGA